MVKIRPNSVKMPQHAHGIGNRRANQNVLSRLPKGVVHSYIKTEHYLIRRTIQGCRRIIIQRDWPLVRRRIHFQRAGAMGNMIPSVMDSGVLLGRWNRRAKASFHMDWIRRHELVEVPEDPDEVEYLEESWESEEEPESSSTSGYSSRPRSEEIPSEMDVD
ncbi:uncharacterized protein [Drosophila takahashii]|uniref:uncharacterized protein n=1 Tax=Drosophila takahashii TaxID=29030 RepID=UPI001CF86CD8|nr:uncharacterized protein LOC108056045 isoform X1 [Drosophila takahashii]